MQVNSWFENNTVWLFHFQSHSKVWGVSGCCCANRCFVYYVERRKKNCSFTSPDRQQWSRFELSKSLSPFLSIFRIFGNLQKFCFCFLFKCSFSSPPPLPNLPLNCPSVSKSTNSSDHLSLVSNDRKLRTTTSRYIMTKSETNKIEIPDIVVDPKNPSKRKFQKGKFLGRVRICTVCVENEWS